MKRKSQVATTIIVAVAVSLTILFFVSPEPSSPLDKAIVKQFLYEATQDPVQGLPVEIWNENGAVPEASGTTNEFPNDAFVTAR